jgi:cytosine/adenosine deaminase-related metal-dependent hydrolase
VILLKNCYSILAPGGKTLEGHDVLIEGNRIARVARGIEGRAGDPAGVEIVDCSRFVLVPGFVNTHHHFYQTLTRCLPAVQNAKLFAWLKYLYEVWKFIDEEAVYYSSLAAIGELLKTGCTCALNHHYLYPKGVDADLVGVQIEAASALGVRFCPCRGSMSLGVRDGGLPPDSVVQDEGEILEDSARVVEKHHDGSELSMRRVLLAPCSPFSVSERLMRETVRLARSRGVRLHTHLAETADEDEYCLKRYGRRPLGLMTDLGFVGNDVSFAHGVFFTDEELETLARTGTSIAHCPSSNMRLGSGIARVKEMLGLGVNVGLAVDGSASNDTGDFLGEIRAALLLQRVKYGADALTAREAFGMASLNGARLLGYEKVGAVEEGWAADLALFDVHRLEYAGALSDPAAALLFAGFDHGAAYTVVNGRIVVREGRLVGFDEDEVARRVNDLSRRLLAKI